jgi:hypothetical protein
MAEVVALSTGISLKLLGFESIGLAIELAKQDSRFVTLEFLTQAKKRLLYLIQRN